MSLIAITVDEGEGGRAGPGAGRIGKLAEGLGIPWTVASPGEVPGSVSPGGAVSRNRALASLARRAGATKIAMGTNLDAIARSVFLQVIGGERSRLTTDSSSDVSGISCITPFRMIPAAELSFYARLNVPGFLPEDDRPVPASFEREVREMLDAYWCRHPSAPFSIVRLADGLSGIDTGKSGNRDGVTGHG